MPLFEAAGKLAGKGTRDVRDELSALLLDNFTRVKDLFAAWDEDTDGLVSRQEFIRACQELGLDARATPSDRRRGGSRGEALTARMRVARTAAPPRRG